MNHADMFEEHKVVTRKLEDADKQLFSCMDQIKVLNCDNERQPKGIEELEDAAKVAVNMVDPSQDGLVNSKTLLLDVGIS
jgi:hypothetical protein